VDNKTPGEILHAFYKNNDLPSDGGQNSNFVKIALGRRLYFFFPNFNARRKALVKHDIHHVLTGYSASSILGEAEISAWEIASGCKKYWAALLIDTHGALLGLLINPYKVLAAFSRGRRTGNLYHDTIENELALETPVKILKNRLNLDKIGVDFKPELSDVIYFILFLIPAAIYSLASIVLFPAVIAYTFLIISGTRKKLSNG
jgi:hypothetical protein